LSLTKIRQEKTAGFEFFARLKISFLLSTSFQKSVWRNISNTLFGKYHFVDVVQPHHVAALMLTIFYQKITGL